MSLDNTFRVRDIPDESETYIQFYGPISSFTGIYSVKLTKGSPFRKLLEAQEDWQEHYKHDR